MDYSTHRFHCYYAKECSDGSYQSLMEYSTPLFEKWEQTDRQFRESQRRLKVLKEHAQKAIAAYSPTDGNLKESVAYIKPKTAIVKRSKEYGQSLKKTEAR